jgi:hypothetical protein
LTHSGFIIWQWFHYSKRKPSHLVVPGTAALAVALAAIANCRALLSQQAADFMLPIMRASSSGIILSSRLPQVYRNYQAKNTGELNLITVGLITAGSILRLFTSAVQIPEQRVNLLCWIMMASVNTTLASQILAYGREKSA